MNNVIVVLAGLLPVYVVRFSIAGIPTTLFEVLVWAVAAATLVLPSRRTQAWGAARAIPKKTLLWAALFLLAAVMSTAISPIPRSSLGIIKGWIVTPMIFGFLIFAAQHMDPTIRKRIIRALLLSGLIVALFGLSQIQGLNRITSIYDVPNSLALFLVPIMVLGVWVGMRDGGRFYLLATIPILLAIIYTQSVAGVISLISAISIGLVVWPRPNGTKRTGILIVMAAILIAGIVLSVSGRLSYLVSPLTNQGAHNSITVRMQLWDIGLQLIQEHPLLGIGLGQFEPVYQAELHERFAQKTSTNLIPEFVFRDPHNWIISFWLNLGILGLVSFSALNYAAIRYKRKTSDIYLQGGTLALIATLLLGLFDTIYWKNDLSSLWWALIALL